jgi:hypothetical protein
LFNNLIYNISFAKNILYLNYYGDWGLGIGDWGLGIGAWAPTPIPQTPNPKPQTP